MDIRIVEGPHQCSGTNVVASLYPNLPAQSRDSKDRLLWISGFHGGVALRESTSSDCRQSRLVSAVPSNTLGSDTVPPPNLRSNREFHFEVR